MNWFSMDNPISATLSALFVSVVGAWIIKRFIGGEKTNNNSYRVARHPVFSSVHVRIDSDFLKTSFTIFCIIILSVYLFVKIPKMDMTLRSELDAFQVTLPPLENQNLYAPTLPIAGESVRVNFPAGSYGTDVTVQRSTPYRLRASALQTMDLTVVGQMPDRIDVTVYDPNGYLVLPRNPGKYVLPTTGDYKVDVVTSAPFVLRFSIY